MGGNMDTLFEKLFGVLLGGGPAAIIAVLIIIILFLWYERKRLLEEIEKKDDKIDKIIEDYTKGNVTLSEALNSLKFVLFEIKGKL
jgi:uncharacterized membrane protein